MTAGSSPGSIEFRRERQTNFSSRRLGSDRQIQRTRSGAAMRDGSRPVAVRAQFRERFGDATVKADADGEIADEDLHVAIIRRR
jgi:hypothetical protein